MDYLHVKLLIKHFEITRIQKMDSLSSAFWLGILIIFILFIFINRVEPFLNTTWLSKAPF